MSKSVLKSNYSVEKRFEAFYTGGVIALNRDGSRIFTTCGNVINILNVGTGEKIGIIGTQAEDDVNCFAVRLNDDSVVVAYRNLLLKHYSISDLSKTEDTADAASKLNIRTIRTWRSNHRGPIIRMCFSGNGRLLATGGSDSVVKIWDLDLQYCVFTLRGTVGIISCMYFDTSQNDTTVTDRFYYGGDDGKILCWDLKDNRYESTLDLHTSAVTAVISHGDSIFTAGRDSVIGVWNRQALKLKKTLPIFENVEALVATTTNGGNTLLIGGGDKGAVKTWDLKTGKCTSSSTSFGSCIKQLFPWDIDGKNYLIVVTEDHVVYFLDPSDLIVKKHLVGYNDDILDVAFLKDDHIAVASNSKDIRVYNTKTSDCRLVTGHSDIVMAVDAASWSSNVFTTGSKDNSVRIWYMTENDIRCVALATGHTNNVTGVRFARSKPHFIASVSEDTTLKVWKLPSRFLEKMEKDQDSERLSSASTCVGHDKDVTCVDIAPNDKLIATGSLDKTVKVWQIAPKTFIASLMGTITGHKRGVWDVCFSPLDQVVATASGDWTIKIFALEDFSCVKTFEGHQTTAIRARFLPSGVQLLSTDSSGLLKLWNIKTGECTKTFDEHSKTVWALELNEDGSRMITGGGDSKLQIWKDITEEEKESEHEKRAKLIADEQALANLVGQKKFSKALRLAIRLGRPFNAFKITKDMLTNKQEGELSAALKALNFDDVGILMDWLAEWNTNSRNCHVAQKVLTIVLRQHTPERLLTLPNIKSAIEALIPYSERHFERMSRLRQQAAFAQYSWQCMRLTGARDDGNIDKAIKDEILHE